MLPRLGGLNVTHECLVQQVVVPFAWSVHFAARVDTSPAATTGTGAARRSPLARPVVTSEATVLVVHPANVATRAQATKNGILADISSRGRAALPSVGRT